jgi:chromosomal replication initiation ATPase DnaA
MNGFKGKVHDSQIVSTATTRSQRKVARSNNNKPQRHQRTDEDIAEITRDLAELDVLEDCKRVSKSHGVLLRAALGSGRSKCVVDARDAIISYLVERFGYSSPECGRLLRMNHATVLESLSRSRDKAKAEKAT